MTSAAAVGYLRRRTLLRSTRAYVRWVGKAVGWWTVGYLVFWLVAFVVSGVQLVLVPAAEPLPSWLAVVPSVALALWLGLPLRVRVPPVHLDRRDLMRLALAPAPPRAVLGYRLSLTRASSIVVGALLGGAWTLLARSYLHLDAPFAALAVAVLAVAKVDLAWLRYAGSSAQVLRGVDAGTAGGVLTSAYVLSAASPAVFALVVGEPDWSFAVTAGLASTGVAVLLAPVVLAACAHLAAWRSLAESWPPRFAPQSLVLSQLGSLRSLQVLSQAAGLDLGGGAVGAERERLLAALHDAPGSLRPRRSLRRPPTGAPVWRALAWRSASSLYRRPRAQWLRLGLQAMFAATAGLAASGSLASQAGGPALPGGALGGPFGGAVAVLFAGFLVGQVVAALLGPTPPARLAPLAPSARTWGRLVPALTVLAVATVVTTVLLGVVLGSAGGSTSAAGFAALALTAALVIEKYSSWTGLSPTRFEPQAVAAIVVALPALLLQAFGYPSWTLTGQWVLLAVVLVIDV